MIEYKNDKIQEKYYVEVLENGLTVYLYPKKDFYKTYAIFSTKYGSQDIEFTPIDLENSINTPEGIAHFLEHKLFENEDGTDASTLFAKTGADVNAFTTANQTAYLFSATNSINDNIELLLDFVQEPCFKKASIDKERGIIEQELLMYLDQPQSVLYFGLLKSLYKKNNVRNEIGGSVESIKQINEELLYQCYHTFYHPKNMVFCVVGNFDKDELIELIKSNQSRKTFGEFKPITRKYYLEDEEVNEKHLFTEMDVSIPKVTVGVKIPYEKLTPYEILKKTIAIEILTDLYFDESADVYEKLMNSRVINNSFEYDVYFEETYRHIIFNLDTKNPEKFVESITKIVNKISKQDIDVEQFEIMKKLYQARNIKRFNSLEYIANLMVEFHQNDLAFFDLLKSVDELTIDDVLEARKYFSTNAMSSFTIYPSKK